LDNLSSSKHRIVMEEKKKTSVLIHYEGSLCWLNVDRVIALVSSKNMIIFEAVTWTLSEKDFNKVKDLWFKLNPWYFEKPK